MGWDSVSVLWRHCQGNLRHASCPVVVVLILVASVLASVQVVRPIWNSWGSCGALRLGKQQLDLSSCEGG